MAERRAKKKDYSKFDTFIEQLKKAVSPDNGMTEEAKSTFDNFIKMVINKINHHTDIVLRHTKVGQKTKSTVTAREVKSAVWLTVKGQLAEIAVEQGEKAVLNFNAYKSGGETSSIQSKADLYFPVTRIKERFMRTQLSANRIGNDAAVFLTAVVEYLTGELVKLSAKQADMEKKKRIKEKHIKRAVLSDLELHELTEDAVIGGGTLPPVRKPKTSAKRKSGSPKRKSGSK
jgi:histone H2A